MIALYYNIVIQCYFENCAYIQMMRGRNERLKIFKEIFDQSKDEIVF